MTKKPKVKKHDDDPDIEHDDNEDTLHAEDNSDDGDKDHGHKKEKHAGKEEHDKPEKPEPPPAPPAASPNPEAEAIANQGSAERQSAGEYANYPRDPNATDRHPADAEKPAEPAQETKPTE